MIFERQNLLVSKAPLYEAFPAAEARRLVERFEWHYTPSTAAGSTRWNPNSPFLHPVDRDIGGKQTLIDEVAAWEQERNANHAKGNWRFTTSKACVKLSHSD